MPDRTHITSAEIYALNLCDDYTLEFLEAALGTEPITLEDHEMAGRADTNVDRGDRPIEVDFTWTYLNLMSDRRCYKYLKEILQDAEDYMTPQQVAKIQSVRRIVSEVLAGGGNAQEREAILAQASVRRKEINQQADRSELLLTDINWQILNTDPPQLSAVVVTRLMSEFGYPYTKALDIARQILKGEL